MRIKQNPVRDYLSVEQENTTAPCMPSRMQPVYCDLKAFLRNAGAGVDAFFLPIVASRARHFREILN